MATKSREGDYKKTIDVEDGRRKREDATNQLRKSKREEQIAKRRQRNVGGQYQAVTGDAVASAGAQVPLDPAVANQVAAIPNLVMGLDDQDPNVVRQCVEQFRKLLSIERNPPIQQVIDSGVVPMLTSFLARNEDHKLQLEAAWALTNIASGTSEHTMAVVNTNAVPIFVQLLHSPSPEVRDQAVWGLGNIAGDSPRCRDLVLNCGAMPALLQLCRPDTKLSMLRNVTWAISNLCRGKPQPVFQRVQQCLPTLGELIWSRDPEVLTDACWALSYLSDDTGPNNQKIQAVIQSGVTRRVVELLMNPNTSVKTPALRTVGNIVTGDDLQTQTVIFCGALPLLLGLLNHTKKSIRKEACWTISNITAGNREQIEAVFDANIVPQLVELLRTATFDIRKEATWAISNATSGGSSKQIRYLVKQGVIHPLCELFQHQDAKIVMVAMEGIENILRVGQQDSLQEQQNENAFANLVEEAKGLDYLERLQEHPNEDIYLKANNIITTYFDSEEVEDPSLAPQTDGQNFTFQAGGAQGGGDAFSF